MSEFFSTVPENNTPAQNGWEDMGAQPTQATETPDLTFPEGTANDAYGLEGRGSLGDEITTTAEAAPEEPAAQPVFSAEAPVADAAPVAETPAATETPDLTFPEGTANDAYGLEGRGSLGDEITTTAEAAPEEPAAQPVFSAEAPVAAAAPVAETPAATETPDLTFPEGTANDAYELEGRGSLGDEIAATAESEPKSTEAIPDLTAPETEKSNETVRQAIAAIREQLDQIEASL